MARFLGQFPVETRDQGERKSRKDMFGDILEKFLVQFRSTLFTIVVVIVKLLFGFVSHTKAMLPDLAGLTLHHEFTSIRVILSLRNFVSRLKERRVC